MPDSRTKEQRLTPRGHVHGEAFCLMWYECRGCGARERIWNSRDGVTPFGMGCTSCGGHDMLHANWATDEYAPQHKLHDGQRFWRDGTPDEAEAIMRRRIEWGREKYPLSVIEAEKLVQMARDPDSPDGEFRRGWPMLDVHAKALP